MPQNARETDRYGLSLSTASASAASAYREGIDLLLSAWTGTATAFDRAIELDSTFAMAHAARARLHFICTEASLAKEKIAHAIDLATNNATERERSHIAILALSINGPSTKCLSATLAHIEHWPRDALIVSLPLGAFGLFAFSGMSNHDQARVDLCERYADHYGNDWWFQTYHGWSLTENGDITRGRHLTERAFAQRLENANAVHALAHAMFEGGSGNEADALITSWLPNYDRTGILYSHIAWHQALVALENDNAARALAIYSDTVKPQTTKALPINIVTDSASLLWRAQIYGHAVAPALWSEISAYAEQKFPNAGVTFADVHIALIAAASGNAAAFENRAAALEHRLSDGKLAAGAVVPGICRAMQAFVDEKYAACAEILEPVAHEVVRIGGSHAQRELIEDTLLVAWMKSGATQKAKALLDGRLHRRPSPRDTRWRNTLRI
ncbi:MAG: tetratricopeptide repeat protein [Hyphomicrobiaceae bacterium]|nr:tetratricopeptide repeat protein [Hyphomicrobiaceae bacterium]